MLGYQNERMKDEMDNDPFSNGIDTMGTIWSFDLSTDLFTGCDVLEYDLLEAWEVFVSLDKRIVTSLRRLLKP